MVAGTKVPKTIIAVASDLAISGLAVNNDTTFEGERNLQGRPVRPVTIKGLINVVRRY